MTFPLSWPQRGHVPVAGLLFKSQLSYCSPNVGQWRARQDTVPWPGLISRYSNGFHGERDEHVADVDVGERVPTTDGG
jgi:hypothetical protein